MSGMRLFQHCTRSWLAVLSVLMIDLAGELHMTPQKGIKEAEFLTRPENISAVRERIERIQNQAQPIAFASK